MYRIRVSKDGGILVEVDNKVIAFDTTSVPRKRPDVILISHAHRDHVNVNVINRIRSVPILMSRATYELLFRRRSPSQGNIKIINEKEPIEIASIEITALNAGHCVGSFQYFLNTNPSIVYTGDFNLQNRVILRPAEVIKGEVLIIDATYGTPRYTFPNRLRLYKMLLELVKLTLEREGVAYIAARSLGTSQEVTALINLSTLRIPVLVDRRIHYINRIHEKYEKEELRYGLIDVAGECTCVKIVPLQKANLQRRYNPVITCTGWAVTWKNLTSLPLSSHSDFNGLIKYIRESNAEIVVPVYGFINEFLDYVRKTLGIKCLNPLESRRVEV